MNKPTIRKDDAHTSYVPKVPTPFHSDFDYANLERIVMSAFQKNTQPLFTTSDSDVLFQLFLGGLPEDDRQHYNCNCCRHFFERYGGLVHIGESGLAVSLLWNDIIAFPKYFQESAKLLRDRIHHESRVSGVFFSSEEMLGTPKSPTGWTHLCGKNPEVFKHPMKTAFQAMAEKLEDYKILKHGLSEYDLTVIRKVQQLLVLEVVERAEKAVGVANWLLGLANDLSECPKYLGSRKDNIVWRAVATAPPGFCHIRSTIINMLLDDVKNGADVEDMKRKWKDMLQPLQYQRPTTVSDGVLDQAEKVIQKLDSAGSLERRFAKLEDVMAFWEPKAEEAPKKPGGVFSSLKQGNKQLDDPMLLPTEKMTWKTFQEKILPKALRLKFWATSKRVQFGALTTAVNPEAPPMLQWDREDQRNTVAWYVYKNGSRCTEWNLAVEEYHEIVALCDKPTHWFSKPANHSEGVVFIIKDCRDLRYTNGGLFFPETLKSEYHGIRKAMEAYSNANSIQGKDEATACGFFTGKGCNKPFTLQVRMADNIVGVYNIDRWE